MNYRSDFNNLQTTQNLNKSFDDNTHPTLAHVSS